MARFIVSHRLAGKLEAADRLASREGLDRQVARLRAIADVRSDNKEKVDPDDRRLLVCECEAGEIDAARQEWQQISPDLLIEPEILHQTANATPATFEGGLDAQAGVGEAFELTVLGEGGPIAGAQVALTLASRGKWPGSAVHAVSDASGRVALPYDPWFFQPAGAMIVPRSGYWSWLASFSQSGATIELPALPRIGPVGWWHQLMGMGRYDASRGAGIRIGVIDTGVGPHPYLAHVRNVGAFIDLQPDPSPEAGRDAQNHGTHVCGIIAARPPEGSGDFGGIAAGADVLSARVFEPGRDANQGDIAEAIDHFAFDQEVDLINLSLGSTQPSRIELDAVLTAAEHGILCICAAGNDGGGIVRFPAAYPQTAAVSAVGVPNTLPSGAMSAAASWPAQPAKISPTGTYLASFSNVGEEVFCTGPGVGIISTVPAHDGDAAPYAEMSGTSMSSPVVCGALATLLAGDPGYNGLPRDATRCHHAMSLLSRISLPLGLAPIYQGFGLARALPS